MIKSTINFYGDKKFVPLKSLKPPEYYRKNPISGNESFLTQSIGEFGVKAPIIINTSIGREGIIINGVEVFQECKKRGLSEVPVWELDLKIEEEKALHVALNTHVSEVSEGQIISLLNVLAPQFFPEYFEESRENVDGNSQATGKASKADSITPKEVLKTTTFRYLASLDQKIITLKSSTGSKSLSELLIKIINDAVDNEWYD